MNSLVRVKLMKQVRLMKQSTIECENFLRVYKEIEDKKVPSDVVNHELNNVIQHQKNMVSFFSILEQQLQK